MKWPIELQLFRHSQSEYNVLRQKKAADPRYREFKQAYSRNHRSLLARALAEEMREKYALGVSDYDTPLTNEGVVQAERTADICRLDTNVKIPDIIFCSPYIRTKTTLGHMCRVWAALGAVKVVYDDRIREQEHGRSLLYNDWRIFHVYEPDQKDLYKLLGPYWYQYPQGESVSDVRNRLRSFQSMLIRECAGLRVWLITHHLSILSIRANLERLSPEEFIHLDEKEKPVNCGRTVYTGRPELGKYGRLVLTSYNQKLY